EPTKDVDRAGLRSTMATVPNPALTAAAPPEPTAISDAGDTGTLRRHRLAPTALLLAVAYAALMAWHLGYEAAHGARAWALLASRLALSAIVAGLLLGRIRLSPGRVRALEIALFGGLTIIVMVAQYAVNLAMVRAGRPIEMVAFMKNGVIQMVILMMLYGTFI